MCGLLAFSLGALQVYRAKIGKRGAVTRGLYRYVRHPQYTALVVASLGMLLIWPRFLVLYSTIVMIFTYVALARAEERICTEKYDNYDQYLSQTGGFVPKFFGNTRGPKLLEKIPRPISAVATMFFVLATATVLALSLRQHAIASLYTLKDTHGIYLSVTRISETKLSRISDLARTNAKIETTLSSLNKNDSFIAYVLPTEMYISEIPMTLPKGQVFGHSVPKSRDINRYKVIYTRAEFTNQAVSETENILYHSVNKHPSSCQFKYRGRGERFARAKTNLLWRSTGSSVLEIHKFDQNHPFYITNYYEKTSSSSIFLTLLCRNGCCAYFISGFSAISMAN